MNYKLKNWIETAKWQGALILLFGKRTKADIIKLLIQLMTKRSFLKDGKNNSRIVNRILNLLRSTAIPSEAEAVKGLRNHHLTLGGREDERNDGGTVERI